MAIFFLAYAVFVLAQGLKAGRSLRAGAPYRFAWWEGGFLTGRVLHRPGPHVKIALSIFTSVSIVLWVSSVTPFAVGRFGSMGLAAMTVIADMIFSKRDE